MDQITGLPAHPLLVHLPVAMLPLAALGVVVLLARRAWYERYRWAVLVVAGIGTVGAMLATSSGESLERQLRDREGAAAVRAVHEHAEAGDLAQALAIVFFLVLAVYVILPWWLDRRAAASTGEPRRSGPAWLRPLLMVAVAVSAVASVGSVINAGHSGASRAWDEYREAGQTVDG